MVLNAVGVIVMVLAVMQAPQEVGTSPLTPLVQSLHFVCCCLISPCHHHRLGQLNEFNE